jgi:hypothetical protein
MLGCKKERSTEQEWEELMVCDSGSWLVMVTKMGFEMGSVRELEKEPEMVLEMETTMDS